MTYEIISGIERLRKLTDDINGGTSLWSALRDYSFCDWDARPNGRKLKDTLSSIVDQIEANSQRDVEVAVEECEEYYRGKLIAILEGEHTDTQELADSRKSAADWVEANGGIEAIKLETSTSLYLHHRIARVCGINPAGLDAKEISSLVLAEIDKRLMPEGMEWPKFDDGEPVEFGCRVDGAGDVVEKFIFTRSMGGVCQLQDMHGYMYNVIRGGSAKRPKQEVLGADGKPINVGDKVYLTDGSGQFEVQAVRDCAAKDEFDDWYDDRLLTHTQPDTQEIMDGEIDECSLDDWCSEHPLGNIGTMIHYYCARQREIDARTMGCE